MTFHSVSFDCHTCTILQFCTVFDGGMLCEWAGLPPGWLKRFLLWVFLCMFLGCFVSLAGDSSGLGDWSLFVQLSGHAVFARALRLMRLARY